MEPRRARSRMDCAWDGISAITPCMAMERHRSGDLGLQARPAAGGTGRAHRFAGVLVAAGSPETPFGEAYDRAAGERPSQVWHLPDVGHTGAIRQAAPEYERRVTVFLDEALTGR